MVSYFSYMVYVFYNYHTRNTYLKKYAYQYAIASALLIMSMDILYPVEIYYLTKSIEYDSVFATLVIILSIALIFLYIRLTYKKTLLTMISNVESFKSRYNKVLFIIQMIFTVLLLIVVAAITVFK